MLQLKKLLVASALITLAVPLTAQTVTVQTKDEVIAKHIEARGGAEAWAAVESMKITGSFTGFSTPQPFTAFRKRSADGAVKYHMDQIMGDKPRVYAWNGQSGWWQDGWTGGEWAADLPASTQAVVLQEAEMATPLFDYADKGHTVELLENADIDGMKVIQLALTRASGEKETWYLDPETYLEVARDGTTDEFGRPMTGRMFFDDFRQVGDLVIPHYSEVEWATRHRVTEIANIELGAEVADALFEMPPPPGMGPILPMAGSWQTSAETRQSPRAPFQKSEFDSEVTVELGKKLLRQKYEIDGVQVEWALTYDRYNKKYRMTVVDSDTGMLKVFEGSANEGSANEAGTIVLSNQETGTTFRTFGFTVAERYSILDVTPEGFRIEGEASVDGGDTWTVMNKSVYSR